MMTKTSVWLSQYVCNLMSSRNMAKANKSFHKFVPDKVTIKLSVFSALVKDWVFGNVNGSLIIAFHRNRCDIGDGELV